MSFMLPTSPPTSLSASGIAIGEAPYPDNIIGHMRSFKMRGMLPYRTELARDYMILCDYERAVSEYRAFPFSLDFYHNNQPCEFLPDLVVVRDGVPTLIYCQVYDNWQTPQEKTGLGLVTVWCMERGCNLEIVTHLQMSEPYIRNIKLLRAHATLDIPNEEMVAINAYLKSVGQPLSIATLAREISRTDVSHGISAVLYMAYHHLLSLSLYDEEIAPDTLLWPGSESEEHLMDDSTPKSA